MPFHKKTFGKIKSLGQLQFNNFSGFVKSNPLLSGIIGSGILGTLGVVGIGAIRRRRKKSKSVRRRKSKRKASPIRRRRTSSAMMARMRRHRRKSVTHRSPRHKGHKRVSFITAKGQKVSFLVKRKGGKR